MLDPKEIGRRIAGIRELREMTLEDVASRLQVSRSTILRYERGEFERIKLPVLIGIANALGVSAEYLSCQTDDAGLTEALRENAKSVMDDPRTAEFAALFSQLPPDKQEFVLAAMRGMKDRND